MAATCPEVPSFLVRSSHSKGLITNPAGASIISCAQPHSELDEQRPVPLSSLNVTRTHKIVAADLRRSRSIDFVRSMLCRDYQLISSSSSSDQIYTFQSTSRAEVIEEDAIRGMLHVFHTRWRDLQRSTFRFDAGKCGNERCELRRQYGIMN